MTTGLGVTHYPLVLEQGLVSTLRGQGNVEVLVVYKALINLKLKILPSLGLLSLNLDP